MKNWMRRECKRREGESESGPGAGSWRQVTIGEPEDLCLCQQRQRLSSGDHWRA